MSWTQQEIDILSAAVASGVLEVEFAGPPARRVKYQSLAEMRSLLASMTRVASSTPTYSYASVSKGT